MNIFKRNNDFEEIYELQNIQKNNNTKIILKLDDEVKKSINFSSIFFKVWSLLQIVNYILTIFILIGIPYITGLIYIFRASNRLDNFQNTRNEKNLNEYFSFMAKTTILFYISSILLIIIFSIFIIWGIISSISK